MKKSKITILPLMLKVILDYI